MTAQAVGGKFTVWDSVRDLGFFSWLFAVVVAGPSILSLGQAIFVDHRLIDALQWIVNGYNGIMNVLGGVFEPLLLPTIRWINSYFRWQLELQPHWRPLFVLAMLFVTGVVRSNWGMGQHRIAIRVAITLSLASLVGAVVAGVAHLDGSWWMQGFVGATLPTLIVLTAAITDRIDPESFYLTAFTAGASFILSAALSFVPALSSGAAIAALGLIILFVGIGIYYYGITKPDRHGTRMGLTIIGGFIAAAIITGADAVIKAWASPELATVSAPVP